MHFWDSNSPEIVIPPNTTLRFLSNVHVPSIPLYLAIAPPLKVYTDNDNTASWLGQHLATGEEQGAQSDGNSGPWWSQASKQLHNGVLLEVEERQQWFKVTEILLYAAVHTQEPGLPTPPGSSPPRLEHLLSDMQDGTDSLMKLYALPLCSDIITRIKAAIISPSGDLPLHDDPCFLADGQVASSLPNKRQRMSDRFDDATQQRRKLKGRDGERVSKAMAGGDRALSQQGLPHPSSEGVGATAASGLSNTTINGFSRTSSIASLPVPIDTRPASRGSLANGRRLSLNRVESALSPRETFLVPDGHSGFPQQNKGALTKVVMAGMRLHGLQQKKKRNDSLIDGDDEYKLVYHQTLKAATFAFRAQFSDRLLGQDAMRDVVDRLLILFCTNPTAIISPQEGFSQPQTPRKFQPETSNAFDLPSSSAPLETTGGTWSTPATKKRR